MKRVITTGVVVAVVLIAWTRTAAQSAESKTSRKDVPRVEETARVINSLDGPTLYNTYCAVCHGPGAKGDGPMAKMLTSKTPDLTRVAERHGNKFPRMQVEAIISGEAPLSAGHGTREMPLWGPVFSQVAWDMDLGRVRVDNLARFLESIQAK